MKRIYKLDTMARRNGGEREKERDRSLVFLMARLETSWNVFTIGNLLIPFSWTSDNFVQISSLLLWEFMWFSYVSWTFLWIVIPCLLRCISFSYYFVVIPRRYRVISCDIGDETSKSQAGIGLTQERSITFGTPFQTTVLIQTCQSVAEERKTKDS